MTLSWQTTESDWLRERVRHPRRGARYIDGQGYFPSYPATSPSGWPIAENLSALARCQASCPWRGGIHCKLEGCPRRCEGCSRAWPFDENFRHIGPVKWPHSNRFDCNRVRWLGGAGITPANTEMWISLKDPLLPEGT